MGHQVGIKLNSQGFVRITLAVTSQQDARKNKYSLDLPQSQNYGTTSEDQSHFLVITDLLY